jgi:RNA 3'-terminal phosphate cyclase
MVDAARGVLNQLLADVYIFTDAMSGAAAGASPGYGLTLVAETTTGCLISAEAAATQVCVCVCASTCSACCVGLMAQRCA